METIGKTTRLTFILICVSGMVVYAVQTTYQHSKCELIHVGPYGEKGPTPTGTNGENGHPGYTCQYKTSDCKTCVSSESSSSDTCTMDSEATCTVTTYDTTFWPTPPLTVECPSKGTLLWVPDESKPKGTC